MRRVKALLSVVVVANGLHRFLHQLAALLDRQTFGVFDRLPRFRAKRANGRDGAGRSDLLANFVAEPAGTGCLLFALSAQEFNFLFLEQRNRCANLRIKTAGGGIVAATRRQGAQRNQRSHSNGLFQSFHEKL